MCVRSTALDDRREFSRRSLHSHTVKAHNLLWILCDTLARWLEALSSMLVELVTRAKKLPRRQEVLPCCGEDVVDNIEHWRLGGQHTHR